MFENNNKKIIFKLSMEFLKNNKLTNGFIILALILISTLNIIGFTVGSSVISTIQKYEYSNEIEDVEDRNYYSNTLNDVEVMKVNFLQIYPDSKESFNNGRSVIVNNFHLKIPRDKSFFNKKNINIIKGDLPKNSKEVILPKDSLVELGDVQVGDEITLNDNGYKIYVFATFSKKYKYKVVGIYESSDNTNKDIYSGMMYFSNIDSYSILVFILLVCLLGYLFLYNIMYIQILKDMPIYKSLRILGMTSKSIRKIIFYQGCVFLIPSVIIGTILGIKIGESVSITILKLSGYNIIPKIIKSPIEIIFLMIIMLFILYLSSVKSSENASNISISEDIPLVDKNEVTIKRKNKFVNSLIKRMAWANIFRNKKKTYLSLGTLIITSLSLLVSINSYFALSPKKAFENNSESDILISHDSMNTPHQIYKPVKKDLIDKLEALNFIDKINYKYGGINPTKDGTYSYFVSEVKKNQIFQDEFRVLDLSKIEEKLWGNFSEENFPIKISGIQEENFEKEIKNYDVYSGDNNKEDFFNGEFGIFISTGTLKSDSIIPITFITYDTYGFKREVTKNIKVMSVLDNRKISNPTYDTRLREIIISDKLFKEIYLNSENYITEIDIKLKKDVDYLKCEDEIKNILNDNNNEQLNMKSKISLTEDFRELQKGLLKIGGILSSISLLIFILNILNTSISSISVRGNEIAVLRAVGMTKKQLNNLIIKEGIDNFKISIAPLIIIGYISRKMVKGLVPFPTNISMLEVFISLIIVTIVVLIINIFIPYRLYKNLFKKSLSDDLKGMDYS